MPATYPDGAELMRFLFAAGMIDDASNPSEPFDSQSVDYDEVMDGVVEDWERDIHRRFLAATFTREYDPPTNRLSRLWVGDILSITSATFYDEAIATTDYMLGPTNAADVGLPFQYVEFFRRWQGPVSWMNRRQLVIVGSFGYSATLPSNVTRGLLAKAAANLYPTFSSYNTGGGAIQQREGDLEEQYGIAPGENLEMRFSRLYDAIVTRYRCLTSGMGGGW